MDQQKNNVALIRVYKILGLTTEEIEKTFEDLAGIQQIAASTELLRVLDKDEVDMLNGLEQSSGAERVATLEKIIGKHKNDPGFSEKMQAAAKSVMNDHISTLKSRGDESQRARIAQVLAGIE